MHRASPEVQGLSWVSRQDDSARAFVRFGDRVPARALRQQPIHAAFSMTKASMAMSWIWPSESG